MQKLSAFLTEKGFLFSPSFDGAYQRDGSQWYRGVEIPMGNKTIYVARFGDWRDDSRHEWRSEEPSSPEEAQAMASALSAFQKAESEEKRRIQEEVAVAAQIKWREAIDRGTTPYLERKQIPHLYTAKIDPERTDRLLVPAYDIEGKLWGYQRILATKVQVGSDWADKFFLKGMRIEGCFCPLGELPNESELSPVLVAEGFATAASLHLATGLPVCAAFNAGNLESVCRALRGAFPAAQILVFGDDDRWTTRKDGTPWNPGREKARAAAQSVGGLLALPRFSDLTSCPTDANDLHLLAGLPAVKAQVESALRGETSEAGEPTAGPSAADGDPGPGAATENGAPGAGVPGAGAAQEKAKAEKLEAAKKIKANFETTFRAFEDSYKPKLLANTKICYRWTGTHYVEIGDQYIKQFAQEYLKPKPDKKVRGEFLERVQISNLKPPEWFDETTNRHINFINGCLNIDTGKLEPHSPSRGFRYVLGYNYDAGAGCPAFDAMMGRITCGDPDLERILDEYMGYALSFDRYWYHKALVLTGEGENGKSTWVGVLKALAGDGNYGTLMLKELNEPCNRQYLDGKLFNISAEVPKKGLFDTSLFKALTSGDGVNVRALFRGPYTMRCRAKFVMLCNELPDSTDTSQGFFRRLIIVPFNASFKHGDPGFDPLIEEKLQGELSGIFNRALAGYRRLCSQKAVTAARAAHSALAQYKMDNDSVAQWVADNLHPEPLGPEPRYYAPIAEIYGDYAKEMDDSNIAPLSKVDFGRKLAKLIPDFHSRYTVKKVGIKPMRVLLDPGYHGQKNF